MVMSFFLNDDLELLKQSAQEFTEKYVAPCVAEMEETNEFPRDLYLKAGELGFLSLIVPEQIGGMGTRAYCGRRGDRRDREGFAGIRDQLLR